MNRLSGDVIVFVHDQEEHGAGDFLRCSRATHRYLRDGFGPRLIGIVAAHSGRGDPAGRNRVDVDAVVNHFQRK